KRTKEINQEIAEIDRELLELKEKASIFKVRSSPHLANPALQLVNDLKQKDGKSIFGTVADLIQFDAKFAHAVEAAAGARLLYVVVDHVDTATDVIERLKRTKSGRATFIPVLGVRAARPAQMNGFSSVLDVINFPEEVRPAMEYIFADTLLVDSVADAKAAGTGKMRMVTLDGEIFERSGIVSGGRNASSILMGNQLKKIEDNLAKVKAHKDGLIQELYSIREDESRLRSHKSQQEVRMKALDLERRAIEESARENEELRKRKAQLISEVNSLGEVLIQRAREYEELKAGIESARKKVESATLMLEKEEDAFRAENAVEAKKREELAGAVSSLRATAQGRLNEQELRKKELRQKEERLKQVDAGQKDALDRITEAKRLIAAERQELAGLEEKIASASKAIEKIFERMKSYEDELQVLGKEMGESRIGLERLSKDFNQLSIRKATNSTRLEDLRAEFSSYNDFTYLEEPNDEDLRRDIASCERMLSEMGNVNMAAIEMYDKKKAEMEEIHERIGKLADERRAIFQMISEIEEHKKEAFFETFYAVSENFKKMFEYVQIGDGYLYLDKPNEPFESGMHIKIKRNNHEHSLNSLSGGETTIVALMFIFALQFYKPSPFYILDEVDAALDKPNSRNLADMAKNISKDSQVIMVSHNDTIMANADTVLGVAKVAGASKLVGVKLKRPWKTASTAHRTRRGPRFPLSLSSIFSQYRCHGRRKGR
ncbi:MAG: AAA family ATPase, partial [Candidatus Micrarchaeota archaeon]